MVPRYTPALSCRLGAATALARCAVELGRLEDLAKDCVLEGLYHAMNALCIAEHDSEGSGTSKAAAEAVQVRWKLRKLI